MDSSRPDTHRDQFHRNSLDPDPRNRHSRFPEPIFIHVTLCTIGIEPECSRKTSLGTFPRDHFLNGDRLLSIFCRTDRCVFQQLGNMYTAKCRDNCRQAVRFAYGPAFNAIVGLKLDELRTGRTMRKRQRQPQKNELKTASIQVSRLDGP